MPTKQDNLDTLDKEFDEKFPHYNMTNKGDWIFLPNQDLPIKIKSFIRFREKRLKEEWKKEVREKIEKLECPIKKNHPKECHFPIGLERVIALIQ